MSPQWRELFKDYHNDALHALVEQAYAEGKAFPERRNLFRAFDYFLPCQTRVVILGQDPYPQPGNACGLAFAVPQTVAVPGSLRHIFDEIDREFNTPGAQHDSTLEPWARQGVLMLNTILTVAPGNPMSHAGFGWQSFTDYAIRMLSLLNPAMVFMLWGNPAQTKRPLIDERKHLVLTSTHPSGLSWGRLQDGSRRRADSFWGSNHFLACNDFLRAHGMSPINW